MPKSTIVPEDINRFACPGQPQLSPGAGRLVFTVQRADTKEDRQTTNLWIAPVDVSEVPRQLTTGNKDHSPRWSPDGRMIAFVSDRNGRAQIWLIPADGGEPWCLPTDQAVTSPPEWSPDGTRLAFTARVFERPQEWEPYPGAPPGDRERAAAQARKEEAGRDNGIKDKDVKVSDVKVITRLKYRFDGAGYLGDRRSQVFLLPAGRAPGGTPAAARMVTTGDYDHESPCWTPGGKLLVVASRRDDADWTDGQELWLVDPDSGELALVYRGDGPVAAPRVSPDGTKVAFLGHNSSHGRSTTTGLMILPFGPGLSRDRLPLRAADAVNLLAGQDRPAGDPVSSDVSYSPEVQAPQWSEDSRSIYHLTCDRGSTYLVRLQLPDGPGPLAGGDPATSPVPEPVRLVGDPGRVVGSVSYSPGVLAYQAGTPVQPDEIYVLSPVPGHGASERKVTAFNDSLLEQLALSPAERFTCRGADGWNIEGWLLRPVRPAAVAASGPRRSEGPFPAVLMIHGGPHGVYGAGFMFQAQLLASNGMAVVYTNPRGSQSYGQAFASACVRDWGGKDYEDIMAGLDWAIEAGIAHPDRLGVTGWSYGGYMTSWTITQTQRFKAAVAGAVVYNRHNFWGTSDIGYSFAHYECGGTPWEDPELLLERSAARYAGRVTTPLLLIHGEADLRCPVEQSEQFFVSLRFQGKTAVMARYPGEYHGFRKPSHKADRFARTLAWFRHYLV